MSEEKGVVQIANVSVAALEWMIAGAQELEIDLDEVLEDCGLNVSASDLCAGRIEVIPASVYCKLYYKLNYMLQIEANRRQGIRGVTPDEFRLMCNCLITAETLREVVERITAFFEMLRERFVSSQIGVDEKDDQYAVFFLEWGVRESSNILRIMEKKALFLFHYLLSWIIGEPIKLEKICLKTTLSQTDQLLSERYQCSLSTRASINSFYFCKNILELPNVRSYQDLKVFLELYPSMLLSPLADTKGGFVSQIKCIMMDSCLKEGCIPGLARLAMLFDISESSLGRRLRSNNITYSEIKEECQFELAQKYMWRAELSLSDIASLLGFSDVNSFSRSFRRWSGFPPATFRKSLCR